MPKQKKLRQWQIKKAVKNSVKRRRAQEADKDPSSWLRPGWAADSTRTDAFNTSRRGAINEVRCLGCGHQLHRNNFQAILTHEGQCGKFKALGVEAPPPGFGTRLGMVPHAVINSEGAAEGGFPGASTSVAAPILTENTTRTVIRFDKKVGAKVKKVQILPSCRKAAKCMAMEMRMKHNREVNEAKRFQRRPPQPPVRPGWTADVPAGYFACPYACGWAQKNPLGEEKIDPHFKKCPRQMGESVYVICNGCGHADMRVNFYIMLLHEATCQSGANKVPNDSGITPEVEIPTVEVKNEPI